MEQEARLTESSVMPLAAKANPFAVMGPATAQSDNLPDSTSLERACLVVNVKGDKKSAAIVADANTVKTSFEELVKEVRKCA
jgi:hypothetical protein